MAKVYMLTDEDMKSLTDRIDRDPRWGLNGGSGTSAGDEREARAHADAHRFYNYQLRSWISEVTR